MRIRRLLRHGLAVAVVVGLTGLVAPASATAAQATGGPVPDGPGVSAVKVVATFPRGTDGSFAESVAVGPDGALYVSLTTWNASGWNTGQVWRVRPDGRRERFGPALDVGVLTGLAFDGNGRLYAGVASWTDPASRPVASGVFRIDATCATRVLTLPTGPHATSSFPNGLAFHGRDLYVSDSVRGVIWRTTPHGAANEVATTPWLRSALLTPSAAGALGVNGIAFHDGGLYAVVADTGRLVRIDLTAHGRADTVTLVTRSAKLVTADGIAFDGQGRLWITTNGGDVPKAGSLVVADLRGHLTVPADRAPWMDYPTQVAFAGGHGHGHDRATTLYVTNGAFSSTGSSTLVALPLHLHR